MSLDWPNERVVVARLRQPSRVGSADWSGTEPVDCAIGRVAPRWQIVIGTLQIAVLRYRPTANGNSRPVLVRHIYTFAPGVR